MTVQEFLQNYGGNECVSIEGYCEEKHYDYFREADEWELSADNPNHYKPTCIAEEPWWNEVKDRKIKEWNIIGGGAYSLIITPQKWGVIISKIDSLITYLITGCQKSSKIKACETHRSQRNP